MCKNLPKEGELYKIVASHHGERKETFDNSMYVHQEKLTRIGGEWLAFMSSFGPDDTNIMHRIRIPARDYTLKGNIITTDRGYYDSTLIESEHTKIVQQFIDKAKDLVKNYEEPSLIRYQHEMSTMVKQISEINAQESNLIRQREMISMKLSRLIDSKQPEIQKAMLKLNLEGE